MSSTSSSDCERCDCSQCTYTLEDNHSNTLSHYGKLTKSSRHVPLYATMAHPLIYYAEVQHHSNRKEPNEQRRKENVNYFVKAFKWYTQERMLCKNDKNDIAPEKSGFATWLDNKYIEYLHENGQHQCFELKVQPTTTLEPCAACSSPYEPCTTTKKFCRIKSPWKKRRRSCKDSGDVPEKCTDEICEFIMQPKDLTRATSDICCHTPTSGCLKSNATIVSSNAPGYKCSAKSQSLSSIYCEKSAPKHIDPIPKAVQECPKAQEQKPPTCSARLQKNVPQSPQPRQVLVPMKLQPTDEYCQFPEGQTIPTSAGTQYEPTGHDIPNLEDLPWCYCPKSEHTPKLTPTPPPPPPPPPVKAQKMKKSTSQIPAKQGHAPKIPKKVKQLSISCQCPAEDIVKVDTQSQYQHSTCECRNVCVPDRDVKEINHMFGPIPPQSLSTVTANEEISSCNVCKEKKEVPMSKSCSLIRVADNAAQTSDHALNFDKGTAYPYPLFLKIVCADKLTNKECF